MWSHTSFTRVPDGHLPVILRMPVVLMGGLLTVCTMTPSAGGGSASRAEKPTDIRLTVVYDNNEYDERLKTAWGFGCLVEGLGKTILFDTGGDGDTLLSNMRKVDIDPGIVDIVVISHAHGDHIGGLPGFLQRNQAVTVFVPRSLSERTKRNIRERAERLVEVQEPTRICPGAASTGELGREIKEQSLLVQSGKGPVLITGCAHPGIVHMTRKAEEQFDAEVFMALGGFHLGGTSAGRIRAIVRDMRELGVQVVAPCHCSGDRARKAFKKAYGDNYYGAGVGWTFRLPGAENEDSRGE